MRLEVYKDNLKDCPFMNGRRIGSNGCRYHCKFSSDEDYSSDFHGRLISIIFTCSHPDCTKDKVPGGVDILE